MRILTLIISPIALFVLTFFDGNSQTFDYFENDPEWRVSYRYNLGGEPPEFNSRKDYIYYFNGDSLVNDTLYLILYERGVTITSGMVENTFDAFNSLIRQEDKRIYQRLDSAEYLLYNFDLEVGDVFPEVLHYTNSSFPEQTVQTIDSILINGNYHRTFLGNSDLIIEGIGHWQGVFNEPMINIPLDAFYQLHCYRQLGEVEYVADEWLESNFNVSVAEWQVEHSLSVYPNPTSDKIFIESSSSSIQSVQVYSQGGKLVYSDSEIRQQSIELDLTYLESGLYFVQITDASGVITQKLVKE